MSKVYVVMQNDYPHSVYADKDKAARFIKINNAAEKKRENERDLYWPRIYWSVYDFEIKE